MSHSLSLNGAWDLLWAEGRSRRSPEHYTGPTVAGTRALR